MAFIYNNQTIIFQILGSILSSYAEYRGIKKTLKPLNDLALKADEISRMSFDGSKYHKVEDAISSVSPEDMHTLSLEEYEEAMKGVYTTSVNAATLDEAPMAYKSLEDIIDVIRDSVDVIDVMKPVYNFKASM